MQSNCYQKFNVKQRLNYTNMRIILISIFTLVALNVGLQSIDKVDKMQQERMQQYCQIDPTMCNQP